MVDEAHLGARGKRRVLVDHRRRDHLGEGAGHLDAGRAAADDDEVDGALVDPLRVAVGFLEGLDDPRRQALRVVERVEREEVLRARGARRSSAGIPPRGRGSRRRRSRRCRWSRSGRPDRCATTVPRFASKSLVLRGDLAQRVRDVARDQHRRRDLVQQGLELVVVVLVDQRDGDVVVRGECPSTRHAGEATTNDRRHGSARLARPPSIHPPGDGPGASGRDPQRDRGRQARGAFGRLGAHRTPGAQAPA